MVSQSKYNPFPDLPFAGNGTCDEPTKNEDGTTTVKCLGPAHPLKPGQVKQLLWCPTPGYADRPLHHLSIFLDDASIIRISVYLVWKI